MVRFKVNNAEEKKQLRELVESCIIGMRDTYTVAERYPKWYLYFPSDKAVQGISEFVYNTFSDTRQLTFNEFCLLLVRDGVIG